MIDTWIVRLAGIVAILSGVIGFVVWFVGWLRRRSEVVRARGEYFNFRVPLPVRQSIQTLLDAINPQKMKMYLAGDWTDTQRIEAAMSLYRYLEPQIDEHVKSRFEGFYSAWRFTVVNRGHKEVADLFLETDLEGVFVLQKDKAGPEGGRFAKRIPVGTLRGGSSVTIEAWAWYGSGSIWREQEIRVTHPGGRVDVQFPRRVWFIPGWLGRLFSPRPAKWG